MKPILKWVGGKTKFLDKILSHLPEKIEVYREPFIGGGSVLIALLETNRVEKSYAYDINENLIQFYNDLKIRPIELWDCFNEIQRTYNILDMESKSELFYRLRKKYNSIAERNYIHLSVEKSSIFLFLNKTCFRGLYREGKNGFNVPFGNYNMICVEKDYFFKFSKLISNVIFQCKDFEESFKEIGENDIVYLDPPYFPTKRDSFTDYSKHGFRIETHEKLFNLTKEINFFIMSNSYCEKVKKEFEGYQNEVLTCKRQINAKDPSQEAKEIIIYSL